LARIPYITDLQADAPATAALAQAIRQRRGGELLHLDRLLLHSPPVAEGWAPLMGRVRRDLALSPLLRELAMCVVAVLNGAAYELHHHAPLYLAAGGTAAQLSALAQLQADPKALDHSPLFDATARAALRLVVQNTRQVKVDDATFTAARAALGDDRQLFELVMVCASYNMVSRLLVAFEVMPE
jgi:alkylhydroperoxidase family enzyme